MNLTATTTTPSPVSMGIAPLDDVSVTIGASAEYGAFKEYVSRFGTVPEQSDRHFRTSRLILLTKAIDAYNAHPKWSQADRLAHAQWTLAWVVAEWLEPA